MITKDERTVLYMLAEKLSTEDIGIFLHCIDCASCPVLDRIIDNQLCVGYKCPCCNREWLLD